MINTSMVVIYKDVRTGMVNTSMVVTYKDDHDPTRTIDGFRGTISELRTYPRALSQLEITQRHTNPTLFKFKEED